MPNHSDTDKIVYYFNNKKLGNLSLLFFGYQKCPPGQLNNPHSKHSYLFVYIRSGKGIFHTSFGSYLLSAGCTFCIFPDEVIYYQADEMDPWEYFWIAFDGKVNDKSMDHILLEASFSKMKPIHMTTNPEELDKLYSSAFQICQNMETFTDFKIFSLFLDMFHHYITVPNYYAYNEINLNRFINHYIIDALDYIRLHYGENISVSTIADHLNISREYFSSLFSSQLHVSPSNFLREYRLKKSSILLTTTDNLITQIAYMVGFNDHNYYSNQFRNFFGISPSQYRHHFHNKNGGDQA